MDLTHSAPTEHDVDLDVEALRKKYAAERDRRVRPDGADQYRKAAGEFGYYAKDPYTRRTGREPLTDTVEVLVIGAGFGGLVTGARLRRSGVESIRLMDEAGDVGGTWYWNRYPGIRCDIESYVYMPLLEEVGAVPEWRYAPGEEIRRHAVAIAERFDLYRDTAFQTRVTGLSWDDDAARWLVETDRDDRMHARFVVTSSGTLTQPKLPGIPGIEDFEGHTFHTSRWDYDYTGGTPEGGLDGLADKRVAVVGTGATGLQVIPHLGRDAAHLVVFQRTPSTVDVRANRRTDPAWAASLQPGWQKERQDNFLAVVSGERVDVDLTDDGWTSVPPLHRMLTTGKVDPTLTAEDRERADEMLDLAKMNQLRARVDAVVDDPRTAEKLKPWYRYMCKRPGFSDEYLPTFNRPDVTLVDTADHGGITRMTRTGVVVGDVEHPIDCVIFATGFEVGVSGVLSGTLPVRGRGGRALTDAWRDGPATLHGFYSHGFPNLFHLGAVQNATSVNFAHVLQDQADHVAAVIAAAEDRGAHVVEPTLAAQDAWGRTVRATALDNSDFLAGCTPGYYNNEGRTRRGRPVSFGPGPVEFARVLERWRRTELDSVLVGAEEVAS